MEKRTVKNLILDFFNKDRDISPIYMVKNFVLVIKLHEYLILRNKYCTIETVSRIWREIREMSEERIIDGKRWKIIKEDDEELYAIRKMDYSSTHDTWEFRKL